MFWIIYCSFNCKSLQVFRKACRIVLHGCDVGHFAPLTLGLHRNWISELPLRLLGQTKHFLYLTFNFISICIHSVSLFIFLSGNASPAAWLDEEVKHSGPGFLISCLEGGGLLSQPTLRDVEAPFSIRGTLQWMDLLLAALDCYNTFTNLRCMQPQRILGGWIHVQKCLQVLNMAKNVLYPWNDM